MDQLSAKHQLWVHTVRTDYRGHQVESWIREPPEAMDSWHLVHAARDAHHALERAVHELDQITTVAPQATDGWPPEPTVERGPGRQEVAPARSPRQPKQEVGR